MGSYSEDDLAAAIRASTSWRGVLRALGLTATSAGSMRSARARADRLSLDYSHFTGQRRWSDRELASAVRAADNWHQVANMLKLTSANAADRRTLQAHALRLGLDAAHLEPRRQEEPRTSPGKPSLEHLAQAGALLAAAWFELCGVRVAWPLEPARYDLLTWRDGQARRIQVKTTKYRDGSSWQATLCTRRKDVHTYGADEIDEFFIIDGDLKYYLIPLAVVGGRKSVNLAAYSEYLLPALGPSPHQ